MSCGTVQSAGWSNGAVPCGAVWSLLRDTPARSLRDGAGRSLRAGQAPPRRISWAQLTPLDGWLVKLAQGWRLPFVVEPAGGHHRHYSVLLTRDDES